MHDDVETPWALAQRRRAEGASDVEVRRELEASGLSRADVELLLGSSSPSPEAAEAPVASAGGETPWQQVQRLEAEGLPRGQIAQRLRTRGLSPEDIEALLVDARGSLESAPSSLSTDALVMALFGAALVVLGVVILISGRIGLLPLGLIVAGLARVASALRAPSGPTAVWAAAAREGISPLADSAPRPRCATHAAHASIGTCPRCGRFACGHCVPALGLSAEAPCRSCEELPAFRDALAKEIAHGAAWRLLIAPVVLTGVFLLDGWEHPSAEAKTVALGTAVFCSPWLLLAPAQFLTRSLVPTWMSVLPWVLIALLFAATGFLAGLTWVIGLWPVIFAWQSRVRLDGRWRALIPEPRVADPAVTDPA